MDAQLAKGVRMKLDTYLSSRHHVEAWVKGGFIQFDALPFFGSPVIDDIMQFVTVKIGHMEINYGDMHFRRTDNARAMYNPFVGNLIMDAFTTEIGGEVYFQKDGFLGMVGITNGEIRGDVTNPDNKAPSYLFKAGYDKQLNDDLRIRLTGSLYTTSKSANNTLFFGDRAGSRYFFVLEPVGASAAAQAWSGRLNPGIRDEITSFVINPFIKFKGLEFFGNLEFVNGQNKNEVDDRDFTQIAAELLYRFGKNEDFYLGGRYNTVEGRLQGGSEDITINRIQLGGGWFLNDNILAKVEYVYQEYEDFPQNDIRHEGSFNGLMIEAVIGF